MPKARRMWSAGIAFALVFGARLKAEELNHAVDPGIGRFWSALSYLDVSQTDSGHRVEYHVEPGGGMPTAFLATWNDTVWSRLTIREFTIEQFEFSPYDNEGGIGLWTGDVIHLGPRKESRGGYGFAFWLHLGCVPDCPDMTWVAEYTVEIVEPPLAADFNFDQKVDFADYLILSYWTRLSGELYRGWEGGDANLDGSIDFDDFVVLAANFGTVREPTASVPEPRSILLTGLAVLGLGAFRRRR